MALRRFQLAALLTCTVLCQGDTTADQKSDGRITVFSFGHAVVEVSVWRERQAMAWHTEVRFGAI